MLETTFAQELLLSLVDNAALVVLAVLGYGLGRRQERIKAREELQKTWAEERRTAILQQWDAVRYLHVDTEDLWTETAHGDGTEGSPSHDAIEEADRLVARAHELRRAVRDHRRLLGKTIADAMYASIAEDLRAAKTIAAGQVPPEDTYENPKFRWMEQELDAMDVDDR
jgi:hypothetical protein